MNGKYEEYNPFGINISIKWIRTNSIIKKRLVLKENSGQGSN